MTSGRRAPWPLTLAGTTLTAAFALPAAYVLWRAGGLGADMAEAWDGARAPLWRTVQLAAAVSASATVLGTTLAWLVVRGDPPLRRVLAVLVPLPLALPSFVGAAGFLAGVAPGGLLHDAAALVGVDGSRDVRGMGPAWLVMTLFTYPYVYLPVAARLSALAVSVEESALLLGESEASVVRRVVLPQAAPAIVAGGLLTFLYTVSDFGAVQLLGVDTLTRVIFATRLSDRALSFAAAAIVVLLAIAVALLARRVGPAGTGFERRAAVRSGRTVPLGRWRWPATAGAAAVLLLALGLPLSSLGLWASRGLAEGRVGLDELAGPSFGTLGASVVTALVGIAAVLPLALLTTRYRSRAARPMATLVVSGFAVPGLVVALSLVFWTLHTPALVGLYQTFPLLVATYVLHFGSQAMGGAEVAVRAVAPSMRESAELLGAGRLRRWLRVELPLMRPGLQAGAGLVLLSTCKELPATLLLAPIGFRTLATTTWKSFEEGFLAEAGLASIMLVLLAGVLTYGLVVRGAPGTRTANH